MAAKLPNMHVICAHISMIYLTAQPVHIMLIIIQNLILRTSHNKMMLACDHKVNPLAPESCPQCTVPNTGDL